jgi:SAM-dependent methyltransferase
LVQELLQCSGIPGDIAFYRRLALEAESPVLELGCGAGRVACALAQAGLRTVGLDRDRAGLLLAARRSLPLPAAAWVQGDMRWPPLAGPFGLVLIPYRGFGYLLDRGSQEAALLAIRRLLAPHGRLALDLFNPTAVALLAQRLSGRTGTVAGQRLTRSPDGPLLRVVSRLEMEALLEAAGFAVEALYGGFDGSPFDERATEMVWVARVG